MSRFWKKGVLQCGFEGKLFLPEAFDGRFAECFWMATHPACAQKTSTPTPTFIGSLDHLSLHFILAHGTYEHVIFLHSWEIIDSKRLPSC